MLEQLIHVSFLSINFNLREPNTGIMAFAKVKDRLRIILELVTEIIYEIEKDCDSIYS
jgi:hypothetical protein